MKNWRAAREQLRGVSTVCQSRLKHSRADGRLCSSVILVLFRLQAYVVIRRIPDIYKPNPYLNTNPNPNPTNPTSITSRRYASEAYAMIQCLSVRQSVCLSYAGILPAAGRVITQSTLHSSL